jgi:hypothetical protein
LIGSNVRAVNPHHILQTAHHQSIDVPSDCNSRRQAGQTSELPAEGGAEGMISRIGVNGMPDSDKVRRRITQV